MRTEALTFVRFIAAIIVVIYHFGREATGFSGILVAGSEMVTFFFVLSGFVMGLSNFNKEIFSSRLYLVARVSRIIPAYFLALLLMLLAAYLKGAIVNPVSLVLDMTLLQSWVPPHPLSINSPAWSLSVEAFFYLIFPVVLLSIKKYRISSNTMVISSLALWFTTQVILSMVLNSGYYGGFPSPIHDLVYYFPLSHFCSFLLGISASMWFISKNYSVTNICGSIVLIGGAMLLVIYAINNQSQIEAYFGLKLAFGSSFFAPLFLLLIISIAICQTKLSRIFSARPLLLLGESSYSLYILQMPINGMYSYFLSDLLNLSPLLNFCTFVLFLILTSILSFLYFELPIKKYIRNSVPKLIRAQQKTP